MANNMKCLWYEEPDFKDFLSSLDRAEYLENPRVYLKAIRVTLIALGYSERYINGYFREYLEDYFNLIYS